ncbi:hypothetical protein WH87_00235 [Devosia epidermidihirudinis]|uniref:Uncharacterized protein n=1 Tax=Devosia epidermidihirudinis TaxID=1293439 RepID=A0A0F5QKD3_9HYPH|nr:hypothetical protein [Devosia epidermidihirudinis]KKC41425.1 hypothetical protein WH87_00235 [Devosia epidermidihirudinis]
MTFQDIRLPSRPLAVTQDTLAQGWWNIAMSVILAALATWLFVWQAPGIWRDYEISQNPVIIEDATTIDGECKTRRGLTDCEVHLVYNYEGEGYDSNVSFAFVDFHSGDYLVDVVVSGDKPELATLSLGLEMLWNRMAVFGVFFLLVGGGAVLLLFKGIQINLSNGGARRPGALTLVPVELVSHNKTRFGKLMLGYADTLKGPKSRRVNHTHLSRDEEPLVVSNADGAPVGVAVKHEHAALPILLDAGLERLDMATEERRAMLETIGAPFAGEVIAEAPKKQIRPLRGLLAFVAIIALVVIGVLGYWVWYVTSAGSQFDSIGMEINNLLPAGMNEWGCDQLQQRFGDDRAPFGCTAPDYVSWK